MRTLVTFFVILSLFILPRLFLVKSAYADTLNKDIGLGSEERTSIRNFEKQTKKSIEDADALIRKKELEKAIKGLENALVSVKEKVSVYENNAQILVSKGKEDGAKIYYREASSLEKLAIQISKSLQELASLEKKYKAEKLRGESAQYVTEGFEYLKAGNLDKADANFKKAIDIYYDNRRAKDGLVAVEKARIRSNARRVSELLKSARNNIQANNFDKAEKELKEVLMLESGNRQALNYLKDIEKQRSIKAELQQKHQVQAEYREINNVISSARQQMEENKLEEEISQLIGQIRIQIEEEGE
ncbi:MAG: hypothetical protein ABID32_06070 [Candidatus Omnitrophota bacterium]